MLHREARRQNLIPLYKEDHPLGRTYFFDPKEGKDYDASSDIYHDVEFLEFNTGRHYTKDGQIIKVSFHLGRLVIFQDVSRMIEGSFMCGGSLTKEEVMRTYDADVYDRFFSHMDVERIHKVVEGAVSQ